MEIQEPVEDSYWAWRKGKVDYGVDEWFLMGSPVKIILILGAYLLFVLKLGPLYMKGRPAYKLKNVLLAYNIFQVGLSLYLFWDGLSGMMEHGMIEKETCYFDEKKEVVYRMLSGHHLYFLAKITELLDTIFFVLRKKWNQISFLHIYHHSIMFAGVWAALKYAPSFSFVFLGTINAFVHVIMYTYYGLSAFPQLAKYLWWKRHITKLQLTQFLVVLVQIQYNSLVTTCPISYFVLLVCWFHDLLFIYLFMDFYIKKYLNKRRKTQVTVDAQKET